MAALMLQWATKVRQRLRQRAAERLAEPSRAAGPATVLSTPDSPEDRQLLDEDSEAMAAMPEVVARMIRRPA